MVLDPDCRSQVVEIVRRAIAAAGMIADRSEFKEGFETACVFMAGQLGERTYLPVEAKFDLDQVNARLVGRAGIIAVSLAKAWSDYTTYMGRYGPDYDTTLALHEKYQILNDMWVQFIRAHPAEAFYALAGLQS
jgi:hypothetical protein